VYIYIFKKGHLFFHFVIEGTSPDVEEVLAPMAMVFLIRRAQHMAECSLGTKDLWKVKVSNEHRFFIRLALQDKIWTSD
jgi:hypothetical protein